MPKATVSHAGVRHDLKSCEGGFVELRQLSYDEILSRRDGISSLSVDREDTQTVTINTLQRWAREFDFRNCIRDHNLEDDNGQALDFTKPQTFKILDPKVGQEIESLIDALNGDDEEDKKLMEAFTNAAGLSSTEDNGDSSLLKPLTDATQ
jgi:hypothetical protein